LLQPCLLQRGLLDAEKEDPFALFVASTNIRYCYYADTHKILGNTYGMLVLQVTCLLGAAVARAIPLPLWLPQPQRQLAYRRRLQ
jgi:tRNA(Met) C34 N-acetyltransferase TmcA